MSRRLLNILVAVLAAAFLLAAAAPARAEALDDARIRQLFSEANAKFRDGLAAKDPQSARTHYLEAIARWRVITDSGIRSAELYTNIGNASLLAGDPGRAMAAFRRAERLDATSDAAKAGLAAARRQAGSTPPVPETLSEKAMQWAGYLPRRALLATFAVIWIAGWSALLVRVLGYAGPRALGPALLILGSLAAAPVVLAEAMESRIAHAVIVAARAPAYNGPSDAVYQPTFQEGLPAGVEVRLLERRGDWTRVRLGDGRETWVRLDDLERI